MPQPAYCTTHQMPMTELRQSQPLTAPAWAPGWNSGRSFPSSRNLGRRTGKIASGESGHYLNFVLISVLICLMAQAPREIRKTISPLQLCGAHRSKCGRGTISRKNRAKREEFRAPCLAPNPPTGRDRLGWPLGFDRTDAMTQVTRIWRMSQQPHLLNRNHNLIVIIIVISESLLPHASGGVRAAPKHAKSVKRTRTTVRWPKFTDDSGY